MSRINNRRYLLTAAALVGASGLVLSGCAASDAPLPEATPEEPVELTMAVFTSTPEILETYERIANEYVESNPEKVASVSFESIPPGEYTTTLTTRLAGGSAPDMAWLFESSAREFIEGGALYDLAPTFAATEGYDLDDLMASATALWREDPESESLYAYPFSNSPFGVFVNTDLLTAAGQPLPADLIADGEWTWDRLLEVASEVSAQTGANGYVPRDFDYKQWQFLTPMWAGWGATPWDAAGENCMFDEPEMVDALTAVHDAIFKQGAIPGPGTTADFFAGEAAFTTTQISRAALLENNFAWDLVPLPEGPVGEYSVIGQAGVGVLAQSQNPTIAADFLAYFTNPVNAAATAAYYPAPRASLITTEVLSESNPVLSAKQLEAVVVEGVEDATNMPAHRNFATIQDRARAELDELWVADADVETVLSDVCGTIEPLMKG